MLEWVHFILSFKIMRQYAYKRYADTIHLMLKEEIDDFKKKFGHKKILCY